MTNYEVERLKNLILSMYVDVYDDNDRYYNKALYDVIGKIVDTFWDDKDNAPTLEPRGDRRMKVVIDIPEKDYKTIVDGYVKHELIMTNEVIKSIANGVVLPYRHGRLIDADYIKLFSIDHDSWNGVEYEGVIRVVPVIAIDNALTIIEADKEVEV